MIAVDSHICLAVLDFRCPLSCVSLTHCVSLKTYSILVLSSIFQHHGASRFASTNVVKQSSGGLFSWLLGGKSSQLPPLDVPLPGIAIPSPLPDFVEPSKTKVTTLPNGVKIASETSSVLLCSHIC